MSNRYRDKKLVNFYTTLPPSCQSTAIRDYPNRELYKIDIPCRIAIVGETGSRKSLFLLNLIDRMNCFSRYYLFCKDITESLYKFLLIKLHHIEKIRGEKLVFFSNSLSNLPRPEDLDAKYSNIIIIDDMLGEKIKELDKVAKLAVYGRHYNLSMAFISQSYYHIPVLLREQTNYICIKKHNSQKRLKQVLNQYSGSTDFTEKELLAIYNEVIKDPADCLMFDLQTPDQKLRIRRNWTPIGETDIVPIALEKLKLKQNKYRQENCKKIVPEKIEIVEEVSVKS